MVSSYIKYISLGYSVIPVSRITKRPVISWKLYQKQLPKKTNVLQWFNGRARNGAVICGDVSGNLLVIDFDDMDYYRSVTHNLGDEAPIVRTKKGFHVYYRSKGNLGYRNTKIAFDNKKVLCEIRANGGYALTPPSYFKGGKYAFIRGSIETVPVLEDDELRYVIESVSTRKPRPVQSYSSNGAPTMGSKHIVVLQKTQFVNSLMKKNLGMIKDAMTGDRNNQLFRSSCYIGELIAGGHIDAGENVRILYKIATEIGLVSEDGDESVNKTISSGIRQGMSNPMVIEQDEFMEEFGI